MRKMGKLTMRIVRISQLELNDITVPHKSGRYRGTSVGRDKDGYFVMTHRCRSKSYPKASEIPDATIKGVRSTG